MDILAVSIMGLVIELPIKNITAILIIRIITKAIIIKYASAGISFNTSLLLDVMKIVQLVPSIGAYPAI